MDFLRAPTAPAMGSAWCRVSAGPWVTLVLVGHSSLHPSTHCALPWDPSCSPHTCRDTLPSLQPFPSCCPGCSHSSALPWATPPPADPAADHGAAPPALPFQLCRHTQIWENSSESTPDTVSESCSCGNVGKHPASNSTCTSSSLHKSTWILQHCRFGQEKPEQKRQHAQDVIFSLCRNGRFCSASECLCEAYSHSDVDACI